MVPLKLIDTSSYESSHQKRARTITNVVFVVRTQLAFSVIEADKNNYETVHLFRSFLCAQQCRTSTGELFRAKYTRCVCGS